MIFTFKHREFNRPQIIPLRTDDKGRVNLGKLAGIESVAAKIPNERQTLWPLEEADNTISTTIHAKEGETIHVPVRDTGGLPASLLAQSSGTFTADFGSLLKAENGFLTISGLKPGDYRLTIDYIGYPASTQNVTARDTPVDLEIQLSNAESVTVTSLRQADFRSPALIGPWPRCRGSPRSAAGGAGTGPAGAG